MEDEFKEGFMADFKLMEVAKKTNMTPEQAIEKLRAAGEVVSGVDATITVEQMRVLGVTPQQMIDRRKERLQQALERRNKGTMGREVVMNNRVKEEPVAKVQPTKKISKEELQKRKTELNKGIQKIDEERKLYNQLKESDENAGTEQTEFVAIPQQPASDKAGGTSDSAIKVDASSIKTSEQTKSDIPQEVKTEPKAEIKAETKTESKTEPKTEVKVEPKTETRAEPKTDAKTYKPTVREPSGAGKHAPQGVRIASDGKTKIPTGPASTMRTRPTGPAADQNKSYSSDRYTRGKPDSRQDSRTGERQPSQRTGYRDKDGSAPQRDYRDKDSRYTPGRDSKDRDSRDSRQDSRTSRPQRSFSRPESATLTEEETRRREKKVKEVEPLKDEPKKPKTKTLEPTKTKDWSKTIIEGINELDIENEILAGAMDTPVAEVEKPVSGKTDRKQRRKTDKYKRSEPVVTLRPTHITIGESVVVSELAGMIGIKAAELVKKLFVTGIIATVNQAIDAETATLLCIEYGVEVSTKIITEEELLPKYEDKPEDIKRRPPVVTVMGHVDHGKTSLLDAIRSAAVAEREAGGITQHIGAYEVELNGRKITFLDTPGHEAFTSLRARGAQVTDIVILVVAANDGVMPQTKEAIDHAKAAGVRIVVAINKIDRPDANPDKVRQQLADYGIISDEWGGDYQFQEISAKKNIGIEDLLERVLLEADVLELQGNPNRPAEGIVIESKLDKQKGPVATILVKNGTLRRGDTFVVGKETGKVRSMYNYRGTVTREAGISIPVEVMGFSSVPESGDTFLVVEDERVAKNIAELRARNEKEIRSTSGAISLTDFFNKVKEGAVQELNIIIKADVQGSLEALKNSLLKLSNVEVKVNVVHDATGGINESDVVLAIASNAIIIGFNVRPDANAKSLAEKEKVSIELYSVIYQAIEDVKLAMEGMLTPDSKEKIIGKVEVRQVFSVPKLGKIAGAYVLEGKAQRNSLVRVIRNNVVIYDGKVGSLRRFTDDVKEVTHGYECGISIDRYQDIKEGDILEIYEIVEEKRTLEDVKQE